MTSFTVILLLIGVIVFLGALLWLAVIAFRRNILWGLATLAAPIVLALLAFLLLPKEGVKGRMLAEISRRLPLLRFSKAETAKEAAQELSLDEKQARLRVREQELLVRKAALKPGDVPGTEAITREIAQYNSELQALLLALNQRKAGDGLWREEVVGTAIPKEPVSGRVHGRPFTFETANLENGILSLRQGREFVAEQEWVIFLFLKKGESPANRSFEVKRKAGSSAAHVHLKWREKGSELPKSMIFTDNYTMQLRFGAAENGKVEGEIYVCLPDPEKSYAAGTFRALLTGS